MSNGDGNSGFSEKTKQVTKKGLSGRSYKTKAGLTKKPKKMRGRKLSSQRWLTRQLNDPFVKEARRFEKNAGAWRVIIKKKLDK